MQVILTALQAHIKQQKDLAYADLMSSFASAYYKNVSLETLSAYSIETLYNILKNHWDLTFQRTPGTCKVQVYNPKTQEVWGKCYTVIMVATDDMPFIVDSLCMAVNRQGLTHHFILHLGNLYLTRDPDSKITAVLPHQVVGGHSEALVYLVVERQAETALDTLQKALETVLSEVQLAVSDWPAMQARMQSAILEMEQNPPPYDSQEVHESKAFLAWLLNGHFIFLGCRDYRLSEDKKVLRIIPHSSLGVLRHETQGSTEKSLVALPPEARQLALSSQVLVFSTTSTKSRIHRPVYTEYIAIKRFNSEGKLVGECRFIGLYTSIVYHCDARTIPLVRQKIDWILTQSQLPSNCHAGKALLDILLNLPRGELLQANAPVLLLLTLDILTLQEKPRVRLFLRQDSHQRFMSCLVYIPKEQLTTLLQKKIETILMQAFSGLEFSFETVLGESPLARIHFLIRTRPKKIPPYDVKIIETQLTAVARSWQDNLKIALQAKHASNAATRLFQRYGEAFSGGYHETCSAEEAVNDIEAIEQLSIEQPLSMKLYRPVTKQENLLRFRLFQIGRPLVLSAVLAVLEKMGVEVMDEWPTEVQPVGSSTVWIHDFGLRLLRPCSFKLEILQPLFQEAFQRIWQGEVENDNFNQLVLTAGLSWREVVVLRAYSKYMRQIGIPFSQPYVEETVIHNAAFIRLLIDVFKLYFDPSLSRSSTHKNILAIQEKQLENALDAIDSLDDDRILRHFWKLVQATLRTNYFQKIAHPTQKDQNKPWLSFKLDSNRIPDLPQPKPLYEIFVYSPQMEGIHLRTAKVARGGLRWSDRREDFRTEILGLMKAQQVKNAVIVPAGAKGGFICKTLASNGNRDTIHEQVTACYKAFIRGMLDITDNIQDGKIIPPPETMRYDEDDPYLVAAADKGTAKFSDIANQVAAEYNFWLGDAFASGGSQGYDHKKMGITARGAWESVKSHCHVLGIYPDRGPFSVVGIGDMSGDVFGNGMLLSHQIKLIAAFNHLHIFIDPNPNPELSFEERKRLFNLPRSSWSDYNPQLISKGGGVFNRSQKCIQVSPEMKQVLDIKSDSLSPDALIKAILTGPVDLLWNGGIGTYVKASHERHMDVDDKNNDNLRVDANQLRCRMVGEGGNLGFTQLARIEYALKGGLIYADFIDNSAGVDCSDHEVNCKILLNAVVNQKILSVHQRNQLLADMTDEIAQLVLDNNSRQTRAITISTWNTQRDIEIYRSYLNSLERDERLNRGLSYLPDNHTLMERKALGKGLTTPEVSILLAHTKMQIKAQLLQLPDSDAPYLLEALASTFPKVLQARYVQQMQQHSLRREIIATTLSNRIVNEMDAIFFYRLNLETGAEIDTIMCAYLIASQVLGLDQLIKIFSALETQLPLAEIAPLMQQRNRLVRHTIRWLIQHYPNQLKDIPSLVERFAKPVAQLQAALPQWLRGEAHEQYQQTLAKLEEAGIPQDITLRITPIASEYGLLDIAELSIQQGYSLQNAAFAYFMTGKHFEFNWLRTQIRRQHSETHWDALARSALLDDLDTQQYYLALAFLQFSTRSEDTRSQTLSKRHWAPWQAHQFEFSTRWHRLLSDLRSTSELTLMIFSMAIRTLASLTRQLD